MKNYLIIGGSSGIGKALVHNLVSSNHYVHATYYKNAIKTKSTAMAYYPLDVKDESISFDFLPEQLDGLVYCPGSINLLPFTRINPKDFINDFELQVIGAIKVIQKVLPKLKASENSSIVLFSTVAVQTGFNFHSQVATSKGAIEGLTKALATELAPKIRINAIAPSLTDTPLAAKFLGNNEKKHANAQRHPLKKIGDPNNIAEIAAFLLSDKASWITGQIIHVDGGIGSLKI
ncbi:SDR family oxidoreductase [Leptobacterium sp. I13]|uniref:SDR family NAD(P)-dependent oxidoreductase n=1 Tax=Leptobacterium meishanense TaxID=3128904 RepID=UPI0030EB4BD3